MSKKLSLGTAVSLMAVTAAITVSLTYVYAMDNFNSKMADVNKRQAMYTKLSEIDQKARQDYIGKIDEATLNDGICAGYVAGLSDVKGKYMSAEKYKSYLAGNSSKSVGVGIQTVQDDDGNMEVIEVLPNSPALKSGIKKGDVIIAIDDKEISRLTYGEALTKLDGTAGSVIKFKVLRTSVEKDKAASTASAAEAKNTDTLTFSVTRAEYQTETLTSNVINGNVGYVGISEFQDETAKQFATVMEELNKKKITGLVVDLRNNSGGSVKAMAKLLDEILPAGNTVSFVDNQKKITVEFTSDAKEVALPISVIVNQSTFGAAEIFASDVKDYKKGMLIGEKTAGSGAKDEVVQLSDGSAIVLSVAYYTTMDGTVFNGKGIDVDMKITLTADQRSQLDRKSLAEEYDPQLQAAVTALAKQGADVLQLPGTGTSSGNASKSSSSQKALD